MLVNLERHGIEVGRARQHFREVFLEDAEQEAAKLLAHRAQIAELESAIELSELRGRAAAGDERVQRLRVTMLERRRLELLKFKEAAAAERRQLLDVPSALASPEIAEPVLDEYLQGFSAKHPHALADEVRNSLRDIARAEAAAAYMKLGERVGEPGLLAPNLAQSAKAPNATDLTPACTVLDYYREYFRTGRKLRAERGEAGISPDGVDKVREGARDFANVMGDMHLAAVTPNHVRQFRSQLRRIPASWRTRTANEGKPLKQLISEADQEETRTGERIRRLRPRTIASTLSGLTSLFQFACDEGHLASNPASGIREEIPSERTHDTDLKVADLNKLFASPWFAGAVGDGNLTKLKVSGPVLIRDHRYWGFLCMLFSGARVSEIGGIQADQVHLIEATDDEEAWAYFEFDWTYGPDGRRLKNGPSARVVPVHRELIRLGFLDYVRRIKSDGHKRLFPRWTPTIKRIDADIGLTKNDYSASEFLKTFKRYLEWLGIKREGISPKSFRASWETATVGKNIDERALLKITGRSLGGELPGYVGRDIAEQLRSSVDQVSYVGLRISHLYPDPGERINSPGGK
jgi:integrase